MIVLILHLGSARFVINKNQSTLSWERYGARWHQNVSLLIPTCYEAYFLLIAHRLASYICTWLSIP